jgi:transposase-like protein
MTDISCKRRGATEHVKNGMVRQRQRYRCQKCGYNFTATPPRGKPSAMRALALLLYAMGNASFCMIGRLLGVSDVAVLNWVREQAQKLPAPEVSADVVVLTLDEMWHFLKKRQKNYGSGEPMTLCSGEPWPGFWVAVMMQPVNNSSTKSA